MGHREDTQSFGYTSMWWALIVLLIVVLVVPPLLSVFRHPHKNYQLDRAKATLRTIAQGFVVYSGNNKDRFPQDGQGIELLVEHGIIDSTHLDSFFDEGDGVSYYFVPGLNTYSTEDILVYEDPKHHDEGVLIAFVDTHVEFVDFDRFDRLIAELPEWSTPIPYRAQAAVP